MSNPALFRDAEERHLRSIAALLERAQTSWLAKGVKVAGSSDDGIKLIGTAQLRSQHPHKRT
jgi:hypothetical protein